MNQISLALLCQVVLLVYHQATTLLDLHPYNGARYYTRAERLTECGVNAVLMGLPIVGFGFRIHGLMTFGVVYYFVLFAMELIIWWVPFVYEPRGVIRRVYNVALACATSSFGSGDTLDTWKGVYARIHGTTLSFFPKRGGRIVPNIDHTLLHGWTLLTAIITLLAYRRR